MGRILQAYMELSYIKPIYRSLHRMTGFGPGVISTKYMDTLSMKDDLNKHSQETSEMRVVRTARGVCNCAV